MRNLHSYILICSTFVVCGSAVAQSAPQVSAKTPSGTPVNSITISAFQDSVEVGRAIYIVVHLTNGTSRDIAFQRLLTGADSKIEVRDAQGNLPAVTGRGYLNGRSTNSWDESRFSVQDLTDNIVPEVVKAGETIKWDISVTKFYVIDKPGKYSVRIERADPDDPKRLLKSNTVTITVTPKEP